MPPPRSAAGARALTTPVAPVFAPIESILAPIAAVLAHVTPIFAAVPDILEPVPIPALASQIAAILTEIAPVFDPISNILETIASWPLVRGGWSHERWEDRHQRCCKSGDRHAFHHGTPCQALVTFDRSGGPQVKEAGALTSDA